MSKTLPLPLDVVADPSVTLPGPGRELSWPERRDWFRARIQEQPLADIGPDEVEVHFAAMPARYWEHVNESDLRWGLETVHGFLKAINMPHTPATKPFVNWRHLRQSNCARVMLCTWDRHGLLAKAAAAFSAVRLNIIQVEAFTRADNVVLDLFRVAESGGRTSVSPVRLEEMAFVLDGALSEPPRFASVWACSRHKFLASPPRNPARIAFDNVSASETTLMHVEASDRLGLLYDILQAMADHGLNITDAQIETENDMAHDVIYFTDSFGRKILDAPRLEDFRLRLEAALNVRD